MRKLSFLAVVVLVVLFGWSASKALAQDFYRTSTTYLHVSNATNTCKFSTAPSADWLTMTVIGHHIHWPVFPDTHPNRGYIRWSNRDVWVYINHSTGYHYVGYYCRILGVDVNNYAYTIGNDIPVTRF